MENNTIANPPAKAPASQEWGEETRIICGFPGVGKSQYAQAHEGCVDLRQGEYYWQKKPDGHVMRTKVQNERIPNRDFPHNYLHEVETCHIGKARFVFLAARKEVMDELTRRDIPFTVVYPKPHLMGEYIQRYKGRQNSKWFVDHAQDSWGNIAAEASNADGIDIEDVRRDCEHDAGKKKHACVKIELGSGQTLADVLTERNLALMPSIRGVKHVAPLDTQSNEVIPTPRHPKRDHAKEARNNARERHRSRAQHDRDDHQGQRGGRGG